jgi:hypothetical protein
MRVVVLVGVLEGVAGRERVWRLLLPLLLQ